MVIHAMSGENNDIKHMKLVEQGEVLMSREMDPSKEEWEQLGFVFTDIPDDNVLCKVTLPEGWSLNNISLSTCNIIDENGMTRGSMYYNPTFYDRKAFMNLETRYKVCSYYVDSERSTTEVFFGNGDEKLFIAGQVHIPRDITFEERRAKYYKIDELRAMAKKFGDENYPGWESVHTYWKNEKKNSHSSLKK